MPTNLPVALILGPAVIAALSAIGSAYLSNWFAERRHRREISERRSDKAAAKTAEVDKLETDRKLTALDYAEHLETYALDCAEVVSTNAQFDHDEARFRSVKPLAEWPDRIEWRLLGVSRAAWARNFQAQSKLLRLSLADAWQHNDPFEQANEEAAEAAKIGLMAWNEAVAVRKAHGLPPISPLPSTWDYGATLQREVDRLEAYYAKIRANPDF